MYNPSVLIISARKELAVRYKKILKFLSADVILSDNLSDAIGEIRKNEFEFIIISDTVKENIKEFIEKVRVLTYRIRPGIIAVSKSAELSDKLELLNAGADDFLSESMPNREFQARINAHIRRHIESLTNPMTGFLNEKLTRKTLNQIIKKEKSASVVLISIDNIDYYREIYGEIAYEKVFQTIGAIILSALTREDTIGHYTRNEFLLFTSPVRAEKLAEFFVFAFDNILNRFYSEYDYSNNFTILSANSREEKKVSLMKIIEAVVEYNPAHPCNSQDIIQYLFNMIKPLKNSDKSAFLVDRPKLYGKIDRALKNKILIMETDEALGLLIETNCTINGYSAKICESYENFTKCLADFSPDLIILDYGQNEDKKGISALEAVKKYYLKNKQKMPAVIFSTNILDKKTILSKGADFYLPKPYDIRTLIKTINDFLE